MAQQTDTQQILQLLQGMNGRFDKLEQRLDRVEQAQTPPKEPVGGVSVAPAPPAASSATTVLPSSVQATSNRKPVSGWKVDVFPYTDKGPGDAPIARVKAPIGEQHFDLHFEGGPVSNQVIYNGSAYFRVSNPGTYVFQFRTDISSNGANKTCGGELSIENSNIIENFSERSSVTKSGSVDLESGDYELSFKSFCLVYNEKTGTSLGKYSIIGLKESAYEIKVLGPDDAGFREFSPDELFFLAPPEKRRSEVVDKPMTPQQNTSSGSFDSAAAYVPEQPSAVPVIDRTLSGVGGMTTSTANLRSAPSRSAYSLGEIPAGQPFRIIEQADRWFKVRFRRGDVGYIHSSLVALQQ